MGEFEVFHHPQFGDIRAKVENGVSWFVGIDVCNALGYKKARNALNAHVDDKDRGSALIQGGTSGGNPNMIIINESGLYSLIMGSYLSTAQEFKHWVTSEVLPSLRKEGYYDMNGQSNQFFESITTLEEHAIKGNNREQLDHMMETYAKMAGISMNNAWDRFEGCYNRAYHTKIHVSKAAYEKKYNSGRKMSNPKYLEAVGKIDKAVAVADQMIKEKYGMPIQDDMTYNIIQHQRDMEFSKNLYVDQFISNLNAYVYSMNYRMDICIKMGNVPCISFADIPREYRNFINNTYPFVADLSRAYQYAWGNANIIYK